MGAFALEAPILLTLHRGGIVSFVKSYKFKFYFTLQKRGLKVLQLTATFVFSS